MADGTRDVVIKIRLQSEGGGDLRKAVEAGVTKPAQVAQEQIIKARTEIQSTVKATVELGAVSEATARKRIALENQVAAASRDSRIKELKGKKRDNAEEIEFVKLSSEKRAAMEEAHSRFMKIKTAERLAIYKREKAEEIRLAQEADAKKRTIDEAYTKFRKIALSERLAVVRREKAEEARITAEAEAKKRTMDEAASKFKKIALAERLAAYRRNKDAEVKAEQEAEARKRAAGGGGGGFFSEQKGKFARGAAGALAIPSAFGMGVGFASEIGDVLKTFSAVMRGDEEGAKRSPLYMAGMNFWEGVKEFTETTGFMKGWFNIPDAAKGPSREQKAEDDRNKALGLQQELNEIILKRTKAERELLAAEKQRVEAARQEFGLMTQQEQQAVIGIARKIQAGGIQGLTGPELEQARGFQGFAGLLAEQAKQAAGAGGFAEVLAATGAQQRMAQAEAKIAAEVKNTFNLELDPADLANKLEERLRPELQRIEDTTIKAMQAELKRTEARIRAAQAGPAG